MLQNFDFQFLANYQQLYAFFNRDRKGELSVAVVRAPGIKFRKIPAKISLLWPLQITYRVITHSEENCGRRWIFKIKFLVLIKVYAAIKIGLNVRFRFAIKSARKNIFSFCKKFLKDLIEIYQKQPKNDFWPRDPPWLYTSLYMG